MVTVALIGPDGAGKSTVVRSLPAKLGLPSASLYMGINYEASNVMLPTTRLVLALQRRRGTAGDGPWQGPPEVEHRAGGWLSELKGLVRVTNQMAEEWFRQIAAWYHEARGRVVIFDRHFYLDYHAYDVAARRRRGMPIGRRLHGLMLERLYPRPDLVVYLDGPAAVLHARKGEGTPDSIERRRREYLAVRDEVRRFVVVDATQPPDEVLARVVDAIRSFCDDRTGNIDHRRDP